MARLNKAVSAFFEEDGSKTTYVAVSAHSGAIRSILQAVNFPRAFNLGTGGMIPIVGQCMLVLSFAFPKMF